MLKLNRDQCIDWGPDCSGDDRGSPSAVIMIRPENFRTNPETLSDNAFQAEMIPLSQKDLAEKVFSEVTRAAKTLANEGISVHLFDDLGLDHPHDSVFPNNWFSTSRDGKIALFPMFSKNRRAERRDEIVTFLKEYYHVSEIVDYSPLEVDGVFLEGTGAVVIDHNESVAYTGLSNRADVGAMKVFCADFGYLPVWFDTADAKGNPIYHTNVMLCVAEFFAIVCLALVVDEKKRKLLNALLSAPGRTVINISVEQVRLFAGNAIELFGKKGRVLALSTTAANSLSADQRAVIERTNKIVAVELVHVELSGGSMRCMLADYTYRGSYLYRKVHGEA
ncbi:citrulline utilization hydrolase CtlX [Pseudomonas sp. NA-150]|uniref:citrulline utilization hydrolase CtlX n=1 Tax=Pseudomonas sp. NA-150 TaxID=3367525 RepID=UPI0037CB6BA8